MKTLKTCFGKLLTSLCISLIAHHTMADVYVVVYATHQGKTGHVGIALDQYQYARLEGENKYDSMRTGRLIYYDLWPKEDNFNKTRLNGSTPALFCKLPAATWENPVTTYSLLYQGIPQEKYPCDALLKIKTLAGQDHQLKQHLDSMMESDREFSTRHYNCTDFVLEALRVLLPQHHIKAKEFIPFAWSSTPNKFCRKLLHLPEIEIIRKPPPFISHSFFRERVWWKIKKDFFHT